MQMPTDVDLKEKRVQSGWASHATAQSHRLYEVRYPLGRVADASLPASMTHTPHCGARGGGAGAGGGAGGDGGGGGAGGSGGPGGDGKGTSGDGGGEGDGGGRGGGAGDGGGGKGDGGGGGGDGGEVGGGETGDGEAGGGEGESDGDVGDPSIAGGGGGGDRGEGDETMRTVMNVDTPRLAKATKTTAPTSRTEEGMFSVMEELNFFRPTDAVADCASPSGQRPRRSPDAAPIAAPSSE